MANDMMNRHNDLFDAMNDWFDLPRKFFDDGDMAKLMQSDVVENDKEYIIKVDMPGMDKNDINLNYNNGILSVSGSRKSFKDLSNDKNNSLIHRERSEGHISRSFRLPNVVASEIHAKYDNGVLTITLPKQSSGQSDNSIQID
ncbi:MULTISPECIES: Hsp20/alpha crystallin family protein [Lactobacillus]|uniref:Hsp20/alpha crystallin family protein n=1 Tax=Lactobacillus panisapium TaxID=2012495 RepID=A0ABX8WAZ5_9LACO|nr:MULTISPECIES: Hsp20/alpha crystallin family protein [Lactobacillus]MCO6530924.1 Hsp20/alpha crystallin family protein [Lactobacillus sp.]MCO6532952.1 Hsp20/alpha crystallin family protein [Lactobacillus sp.]MCO6534529.1 Hsp20/alpha crystallin family protein [Lactobacillus sp.]MCT6853291.1 Hsp20/alpha crystallin family protein [Lactobacillus panisapium]MCX8720395.1 Hsp20/alpha crystallin family protein [Lactobacillus sp. B4010]